MEFKVCVKCMTFNQASYIEDAMNGFCMQKTNFPYLCVIVDDCSKDGEQEVIKQYLNVNFEEPQMKDECDDCERVLVKHKSNDFCYFLVVFLKYNHYSTRKTKIPYFKEWNDQIEYTAFCEGDDYWIDSMKLRKQVDILDSNPDCTLCYHACKNLYEEGFNGLRCNFGEDVKDSYCFEDVVQGYHFQTATVVCRTSILQTELYTKLLSAGFSFGDTLLYMTAAHFGQLKGMTNQMSIYRRTINGISNSIHTGNKRVSDCKAFINTAGLFSKKEREIIFVKPVQNRLWMIFVDKSISFKTYLTLMIFLFVKSPYYGLLILLKHVKALVPPKLVNIV